MKATKNAGPTLIEKDVDAALAEFYEWLTTNPSARQRSRKPNTLTYYRSSLNQLVRWLDTTGACLHQIDARKMRQYFIDREKKDAVSRTTIYHDFICARKFLAFAKRKRYISGTPLQDIVYGKPKGKPVQCPSDEDVAKLLQSLTDRWDRTVNPNARYGPDHNRTRVAKRDFCMVYAIYLTGARPGEIVGLTSDDVLYEKTPTPALRLRDTKEGAEERIVFVTTDWITKLDSYKKARSVERGQNAVNLFDSEYGGAITSSWLTRKWKAYAEYAGLPHMTLKWFRRYRAKNLVRVGDLNTASDILGNSPKVLKENYLDDDMEYKRSVWQNSLSANPITNKATVARQARRRQA